MSVMARSTLLDRGAVLRVEVLLRMVALDFIEELVGKSPRYRSASSAPTVPRRKRKGLSKTSINISRFERLGSADRLTPSQNGIRRPPV